MADYVDRGLEKIGITISKPILAMTCIIFGTIVILLPNLLVWIVGLFLIVQGTLIMAELLEQGRPRTTGIPPKSVYCSHCGTSNIEEAFYCKKCGQKLEQARQKRSHSKTKRTKKN